MELTTCCLDTLINPLWDGNHIHGIEGGLFIALSSALVIAPRQTVYTLHVCKGWSLSYVSDSVFELHMTRDASKFTSSQPITGKVMIGDKYYVYM